MPPSLHNPPPLALRPGPRPRPPGSPSSRALTPGTYAGRASRGSGARLGPATYWPFSGRRPSSRRVSQHRTARLPGLASRPSSDRGASCLSRNSGARRWTRAPGNPRSGAGWPFGHAQPSPRQASPRGGGGGTREAQTRRGGPGRKAPPLAAPVAPPRVPRDLNSRGAPPTVGFRVRTRTRWIGLPASGQEGKAPEVSRELASLAS